MVGQERSKANGWDERSSRRSRGWIGWEVTLALANIFAWLEVTERAIAA